MPLQLCFEPSTNLAEAALWLGTSRNLNENSYKLKIKADFLAANSLHAEALKVYIWALESGLKANIKFNVKELQSKIALIKRIGKDC